VKTIGIIGGLGPQATIDFEERLHKVSQKLIKKYRNEGYPPIITYFFRKPPIKLTKNGTVVIPLRPSTDFLKIIKKVANLANFLVVPSNTPHVFAKEIEKVSGKKFLNMIDLTIDEIKKLNFKKVGILAIGHTLSSGLYQKKLDEIHVSWITVDQSFEQKLDNAIFLLMEGNPKPLEKITNEAIKILREQEAEAIILGCSELPLAIDWTRKMKNLINPVDLLAEAAIKESMK